MIRPLIEWFINRSLVVNLITVLIVIVGSISLFTLQKEMFPKVEFDVITISTIYPGTTSEDVEKLVTITIEREIRGVDGIRNVNALSLEGMSLVYIEVEPDSDLQTVLDDINQSVNSISDLPAEAEKPVVRSANNNSKGVIKIALTGGDYSELREISKKLRDHLERKESRISLVSLEGYRIDDIRIYLDLIKMNRFEVTIDDVKNSIKNRNLNLSAGKIETPKGDILIRTVAEFVNEDDIKKVIVRSNDSGQKVHISDIARVVRAPVEGTALQRSQGKEAIFLQVSIRDTADIVKTTDSIKQLTEKFFSNKERYEHLSYSYTDDLSYYVKRRLNVLKDNGLLGLGLVFVCLLLFLNFSTSVITSLGAPIAFMVSFAVMQYMGVSLNLISMFGLILVLGMLVDDSIIVSEHFYQKIEDGMEPKEAALEAAVETVQPVTATVLTTIVAFGALFFMGGIMGKFLWPVPAVVIICLGASLFECFFILPSHLADFVKLSKKHNKNSKRWYDPVLRVYEKHLTVLMKSGWRSFGVMIFFLCCLIGSGLIAKSMKFELFPGDDVRTIFIQIKGEVGTPLDTTDEEMKKIENIAMNELKLGIEYDQVKTQVGQLVGEHGIKTGSHYGSLVVYLTDPTQRERSTDEIISSIVSQSKKAVTGYEVSVKKIEGGPPKGKPVEIELMDDSIEVLKNASKEVEILLAKQAGVTTTEIDFETGKKQYVAKVNDAQASRLGLSVAQVATKLRSVLAGDAISEIRESDEDIEIKMLLDDQWRSNIKSLDLLFLTNNQGRRIPLSKVVSFEQEPGAFVIRRLNRKRIFSVSAILDKQIATPLSVINSMRTDLDKVLEKYPSVDYAFGGENKDTQESMQELFKSFGIAMLCIFFILVIMFHSFLQPVIIMLAIPLGMIGVVLAFKAKGIALSFMAMLGVVGLVGVVVNDSIVLVNFINLKVASEIDKTKAIIKASVSRFRPVMLTTFTTVAGLLPVAEATGGDPFIRPMAISFAYGLLFATFVTLIFVPCTYLVYYKCMSRVATFKESRVH
ncbi:efflux RND transporter permease subunit [Halobacteriovorax sp. HLS]|uniref:efflux RND transporter permease subunit n=1 Tax=Halobacteriovorax sp. HLS TaxID=2234000 RepID=UPI000FDBB3DE|nr:efflux RND transporter permease subunit [Halobacteriovorax sp. HLS]